MSSKDRLIAVGDIHGCLSKLQALMDKICPSENDLLIFLGDYIDRGPDTPGVIDYLLEVQRSLPSVFLLGNHEDMLLQYLRNRYDTTKYNRRIRSTIAQYSQTKYKTVPDHHLVFFDSLSPFHETDNFIFVHAGLRPGIPLQDQRPEDLIWIRDEFLESEFCWEKTVVFGHTPQIEPYCGECRIGLDTGAYLPSASGYGRLTGGDVQTRSFYSV